MQLQKYHKILVVRTDRIGDVVLTSPVFKALRIAYPTARISVLVTSATFDLVSGNPYIDEVLVDDMNGRHRGFLGALRLAREVRKRAFDSVFIFHTKRRYNGICFLAGVPKRIGYKNNKFGFLLTHPVKDERFKGQKHEAQYCIDLLRSVGIDHAALDLFIPKQKIAEDWVLQWMEQKNVRPGEMIAVHPGASDPTKIWPMQSFADLIKELTQRHHFKIVLIGGPETAGISSEVARLAACDVLDLTGKMTVGQMASILRRCRILISNDSGPAHVGAGVSINVIALFLRNQQGINPERWKPLGPKSYILANKTAEAMQLDKKGAVVKGKPDSIKVEEVANLVEQILAEDNQSIFYW